MGIFGFNPIKSICLLELPVKQSLLRQMSRPKSSCMTKITLSLVVISVFVATPALATSFEGPLVVKNGQPLYAALNSPSLVSAETENSLNIDFSYSSTYLLATSNDWRLGIDLETALLDIQYKKVIEEGLELGLDVPVIRYGSGFLDNVINSYHRLIGLPNAYGRKNRPPNVFLLEVTRDGKEIVQGKPNETALGDVMLEAKKKLYRTASSTISVQAYINLPTGDPKYGYGTGRANGGIAALANERLRDDIMLYLNVGVGLIHELAAVEHIELKNYYYGGAGFEWIYSPKLLLNLQMIIQTSPFPKTGIVNMDNPSMMGSFGGRYRIDSKTSFGLSVTEDPDVAGAPDIMMGLDYRHHF
jgi:hypothetical protein